MEDTIATASKNLLSIKTREFSHKAFRALQVLRGGRAEDQIGSILIFPPIESEKTFSDLANRLGWYLPTGSFDDLEIHYLSNGEFNTSTQPPNAQANYQTSHLPFRKHPVDEAKNVSEQVDRILIWDKFKRLSFTSLKHLSKVEIIDPSYYSGVEPGTWGNVSQKIHTPNRFGNKSSENFRRLEQLAEGKSTSFVFGTGPSVSDVFEYDIPSDAVTIICNSMVKNDELLEHIQPDLLAFADYVFHFGPSRYAARFRQDAVQALRNYDMFAAIPKKYQDLLSFRYPELEEQLIGIESIHTRDPIVPDSSQLVVKGIPNIMTAFMLPIAVSLTDEVFIAGADGRKETESYFWEHSKEAQYDDELMETVVETHPAFFRDRVYKDYYEGHVDSLTEMISYWEERGNTFHTITNSYIPPLAKRRVKFEELDFSLDTE